MKLARLLAHDEIDSKAVDKATGALLETLTAEYGIRKRTKSFRTLVEDKAKVQVRAVNFDFGTNTTTEGGMVDLFISPENLDDLFEAAGRRLGEGLHKAWWRRRVEQDSSVREKAKIELVALVFLEDHVIGRVEKKAQKLVQQWLRGRRAAIAVLSESRRNEYDEVRRLASEPEEGLLNYPQIIEAKKEKPSWGKHLYVDDNGVFPCKVNAWETKVVEIEIAKDEVIGWIRNLDRKPWSVCIPYKSSGEWRPFYPDFLVIRMDGKNLLIDILDPHSLSLEDAPAKAVGLAEYAQKHGDKFGRIELIIVDGERMRRLNLADEATREKVKEVTTHEHLRQVFKGG